VANITGNFTSDGVSAAYSAQGNIDVSVTILGVNQANCHLQVSYDAGTTWKAMNGGNLGNNSVDRIIVSGSATTQYRIAARGVTGTVPYFLGAE